MVYNPLMQNISQLTTDFLSQSLGTLVEDFTIEQIGADEGFMADVFRLYPTGPALPDSLILKMPALDPDRRELARRFGSYQREARFYRQTADNCGIRVPTCYYNDEADFLIIMEDIGHWPTVDPGVGASARQAEIAVDNLAVFHRNLWLQTNQADAEPAEEFAAGFNAAADDLPQFTKAIAATSDFPDAAKLTLWYGANSRSLLAQFTQQPQVLSHMDFRLENLRFRDEEMILFDWGETAMAPIGFDLACFFTSSLSSESRQASEASLLARYQQTLTATGEISCSVKQLLKSYQMALLPCCYLAGLVLTRGEPDYGRVLTQRHQAALTDHLSELAPLMKNY